MLVELTLRNFLSFKDETTLSLVASNISELQENTFETKHGFHLLKSTALYGANASGKTNIINSIGFIKNFVINSSKNSQTGEKIATIPFMLEKRTLSEPSLFEIVLIIQDTRYRYGFEVNQERVISEWLFHCRKRETNLFTRTRDKIITSSSFKEGTKSIKEKTRENALFLSVCAQFNGEISSKIINWFYSLQRLSGSDDSRYQTYSLEQIKNNSELKRKMMDLLKRFDIGITDMKVVEGKLDLDNFPNDARDAITQALDGEIKDNLIVFDEVEAIHILFDGKKQIGTTSLDWDLESNGTRKLLNISGPLFDTLREGYILFVDELDTRLHPLITRALIRLFHSNQTNPNNAQLIFATHDPKLMSGDLFRRDQIWFTEKDSYGISKLFSLLEYKPRKDVNIEKAYMEGRFGGIPYIKNIVNSFTEGDCRGKEN